MQSAGVTEFWELAKGVMLSLTTIGVGWIAKSTFALRDDVRDLKKAVGIDGNGLLTKAADNSRRLDLIDDRHLQEDTVTEIERELSHGQRRRFRDRLQPERGEENDVPR